MTKQLFSPFQTYFTQTTYYKSMLESKNKVYQKIIKTGQPIMDMEDIQENMTNLNTRFQVCILNNLNINKIVIFLSDLRNNLNGFKEETPVLTPSYFDAIYLFFYTRTVNFTFLEHFACAPRLCRRRPRTGSRG